MTRCYAPSQALATALFLLSAIAPVAPVRGEVRFGRDVRPLIADRCFSCHGPGEKADKGNLRLHREEALFADRGGRRIVVPRRPDESELVRRLTSADPTERMPPPRSGKALSEEEIGRVREWIATGARTDRHWAFLPPGRPEPPAVTEAIWPRNPIDRFNLARLEREGLAPAPEADRATLLRRVTLDLTGLPPSLDELDAFLADDSPGAYERAVDRLLASPRYGERQALPWLDAARYADTHGYLFDTERTMWRWRDWVIAAFNANQPFDDFTVEQLAGDLLPGATQDQRIATGFNRNHLINNEAGAIPAEYLVENVFDRVETTGTVFLGLTVGCARCHDHKHDPISQKEYYQVFAFFNTIPELGLDGFNKNAVPLLEAPTPAQERRLGTMQGAITEAEQALRRYRPEIEAAQAKWEKSIQGPDVQVSDGLAGHWPLDNHTDDRARAGHQAMFKAAEEKYQEGILGAAGSFDGLRYLDAGDVGRFDVKDAFSIGLWVRPDVREGRMALLSRMEGEKSLFRGYALQLVEGSAALYLIDRFADNMIHVQTKARLEPHRWHHVLARYDGSGKAAGVALYVDGKRQEVVTPTDSLKGTFATDEPLHIANGHPNAKFKGRLDEVRLFARALGEDEITRLPGLSLSSLVRMGGEGRTAEQARRLRDHFLDHHTPDEWRSAYRGLAKLREQRAELLRAVPTVMVMQEADKARGTFVLARGAYDKPGEKVTAGTPASLPPLRPGLPINRLGLARWLTDPGHPLTARVTVNRFWLTLFGTGLVATPDDFGVQGEYPSHPELLDWLATEFIRSGWDVKRLLRLIVTSATYRQSSRVTPRLRERDPDNRLLARGPAFRLPAEFIRDQALGVSGLLVERLGGPSVKPYQPEGLWREGAFDPSGAALTAQVYVQDQGADLYRRGLYTYWKRTAPPPTLSLFDAPDRERCVVRRSQTNTPVQALALLNDPTFVEAARKLAERMMLEAGPDAMECIAHGFRLATARLPAEREAHLLLDLFREQAEKFTRDRQAARALLGVGESPRDASLDEAELAAHAVVAGVILNLDEVITRR